MMYIAFFWPWDLPAKSSKSSKSSKSKGLASRAVVGVIIVQADDSHHVTDGSVP